MARSYEKLRKSIIEHQKIDSLLHLGPRTFDEISGEVVQNAAFVISKSDCDIATEQLQHRNIAKKGTYFRLVDGNDSRNKERMYFDALYRLQHKVNGVDKGPVYFENICQRNFEKIPSHTFSYWIPQGIINTFKNDCLGKHSQTRIGLITGDNEYYIRNWFEINYSNFELNGDTTSGKKWFPQSKGGNFRRWYGNNDTVIDWSNDGYELQHRMHSSGERILAHNFNLDMKFRKAVTWTKMTSSAFNARIQPKGFLFNDASANAFISDENTLSYILGFVNSKIAKEILKIINPTLNYLPGNVDNVPIIFANKEEIVAIVNDTLAISKNDWDVHETSWDFKINELYRLGLGLTFEQVEYSLMTNVGLNLSLSEVVNKFTQFWQEKFMRLHANEEELNRKFIEIYGLQDELTPDVTLDEITILQKGEISIEDSQIVWHKDVIIKQFISWMVGCFMGRYSADKPGLIIASQGQKVEDLDLPAMTLEIDDDGIIPIIQESDFFTDDMTQRIEAGMKALFGEQNFYDNMKYIKACLGQELRDYLYKDYYDDHLQMYSVKGAKRPIYWLFSSKMGDKKKKGYFKALVYMHRIESDTLSKLHADYVSPYIDKVEQQLKEAEDDAVRDDLSQAQRNKANKLAAELAEKVREVKEFATILAQMSTQRLTIDLDDGVKTNYPKYYPLVEPIKGLDKE